MSRSSAKKPMTVQWKDILGDLEINHSYIHYLPPAEFMRLSAEEKVILLRNAGLEDKMDIIIEKTAQVCHNLHFVITLTMLYLDAFPKLGWFPVDCYLSTQH